MSYKNKGFARERELARYLWKQGFAVIRAPASGAKTKRVVYPDIIAIKKGRIFVIEVKTRERPETIYIDKQKIHRMIEFIERSSGEGFIAVKIMDGRGWRFIPITMLEKTPKGNYKVSVELLEKAMSLDEFIRYAEPSEKITKWVRQA